MSKLAKEYYDKLKIVGLRYFNVYGPREYYKNKKVKSTIERALKNWVDNNVL